MEIPRLDVDHRIGDTFAYTFQFRQNDGSLRSFAGSTVIFHAQSGTATIHLSSPSSSVSIIDGTATSAGPGGVSSAILVKVPYTTTAGWTSGQKWFYEVEEWIGGERYTLINGVILATAGVVDGAD